MKRVLVTAGTVHGSLDAKKQALWDLCERFVQDQRITCPEAVAQCDRVIENAYEFIENVCDIVGYASSDAEEGEG